MTPRCGLWIGVVVGGTGSADMGLSSLLEIIQFNGVLWYKNAKAIIATADFYL
jgi:hypothetical protein